MLEIERKMNTIKQIRKGDNAHQRPPDITQLSKNRCSRNFIKNVFDVNLHNDPIRV